MKKANIFIACIVLQQLTTSTAMKAADVLSAFPDFSKTTSALPFSWGDVIATTKENQVLLNWSTLQEAGTSYFIIEHSTNGKDFKNVAIVFSNNESSPVSQYSFTHETPDQSQVNYYRIKQMGAAGKSNYSLVRSVAFSNNAEQVVASIPNPVTDLLTVTVLSKEVDVIIRNQQGIAMYKIRLVRGAHQLYTSNWASGVYHVSVYEKGHLLTTRRVMKV